MALVRGGNTYIRCLSSCRASVFLLGLKHAADTEHAAWFHLITFVPPGEVLSLMEDLFSGLGSSCIVAGKRTGDHSHSVQYSVVFKCLEPDSLYK